MEKWKENGILCVNVFLLLWAILVIGSIFVDGSGELTGMLAIGNALFLFVNIPFAVVSFLLKKKGCFSKPYERPISVLSLLNLLVGIAAWLFVSVLFRKP